MLEETINSKRIVIPDIKPFDVIRNAMVQSISKQNEFASFVFYETKSGYHFRSLESLYAKKSAYDYAFFQANQNLVLLFSFFLSCLFYQVFFYLQ